MRQCELYVIIVLSMFQHNEHNTMSQCTARRICYLDEVFVIPVAVMSTTNVTDMPRGIIHM